MKRTLSSVLAFLLLCSVFVVPGLNASATGAPVFELSSHRIVIGDTFDVALSIKNCPGIASVRISVDYDSDLVLDSVTYGDDFTAGCQAPFFLTSPVILNWVSLETFTGDAVFATLRFTVPEGTVPGEKYISINFDPDDVCDINEDNVDFNTEDGLIEVANCFHEHTEIRNARPITMTQKGYTGDVYCLDCDEIITAGEEFFILGDTNIDGVVDIKDLVRIKRFLADNTVEISIFADISGNGLVLSNDLVYMRALILNLEYTVEEE